MGNFLKNSLLYFAVLICGGCANIVMPSGGDKDVMPPVVLKTQPNNFCKNFKGNSFEINFNEFVKLANTIENVIVSPFMKEAPELKLRNKSVIVTFKDTLKPNTTYTVSFGNAISDITESNILYNYRYVFSTGDIIDSLSLQGFVKNAFTLKPEKDVIVMLYEHINDSVPLIETPVYISKTNESGAFSMTSLKNGKYKFFALKDENSNYIYDQPNEKIAFFDSLLSPTITDTSKADSILKKYSTDFFLFQETPQKQQLLKAYAFGYGKLVFVFRKPVQNLTFIPLSNNISGAWYIKETGILKDTVTLWMNNPDMDTLILQITENSVILDTAEIVLLKKGYTGKSKGKNITSNIKTKVNVASGSTFDYYRQLIIENTVPVAKTEFEKIIFKENNDTVKASYIFTDSIKRIISIDYKLKEQTDYSLFIPPGAINDIFGTPNDTVKITFKTSAAKDYGNINLKIKSFNTNSNLIIQLLKDNDIVVQEKLFTADETIKFNNISPANYRFKAIYDKNSNNTWDTGEYLKNIQPEKVCYYPSELKVRANWDMDIDWEIEK